MPKTQQPQPANHVKKRFRVRGTACLWPRAVEAYFGISSPTRWRWERLGLLPPRDVFVGGRPVGWRPETIERAAAGGGAR
jgi:predicted DNA-binding transcriptional regulator AlpA